MTTVHMRVGKAGITQGLLEEIERQIAVTDPLTIKLMQNFRQAQDRKEAASEIAEKTRTRIHSFVGGTLILTRKH